MFKSDSMFRQVVYTSVATFDFSENDLQNLLSVSRVNNARDAISGILLFRNGMFMQVIEGPHKKIHDLLERLKKDQRHGNLLLLYDEEAETRDFPNWSMAFYSPSKEQIEGLSDFLRPVGSKDELNLKNGAIKKLLMRFKSVNMR